jgi:Fanconi anemia group J protein
MLLAVCRGKVSEGINFKYENARAVFILGIPYPPIQDAKVKYKKEYNDAKSQVSGCPEYN